MAQTDGPIQFDGFTNLLGGKDGGRPASDIGSGQFVSATNISLRGGSAKTRPAFNKINLCFNDSRDEFIFRSGLFQGAYYTDRFLYAAVAGTIFQINPEEGGAVTNLSQSGVNVCRFSSLCHSIYFEQAGQYLVIQDGIHNPLIIGDNVIRASNPQGEERYDETAMEVVRVNHELTPGTIMAFGQGRLFVAYPNSNTFYASDPEFPLEPEQVLRLSEQRDLFRGGPLQIPAAFGPIRAMKFIQRLDSTTGDGQLIVFGENGAMSFWFPPDRGTWRNSTISRYALVNAGAVSHNAVLQVNSDLVFRSTDGIRSFNVSYQEFNSRYANTPVSREVNDRMREDLNFMARQSYGMVHDNRVMFTTSPYQANVSRIDQESFIRETRFRGILSMDTDTLSGMTTKSSPAYEDVWTGLEVVGMASGIRDMKHRGFIFHREVDNTLSLSEIDSSMNRDNGKQPIRSTLHTRAFRFNSNFSLHELMSVELWLSGIRGALDIKVFYKPDNSAQWIEWEQDGPRKFDVEDCILNFGEAQCDFLRHLSSASIRRLTFNSPPEEPCDPIEQTTAKRAAEFQIKVEWTGSVRIDRLRVMSRPVDESVHGQCLGKDVGTDTKVIENPCDTDYVYHVEGSNL